ncbi:hypothetical protein niasHT_032573 [Heterodera trifolii]|uniref:Uncharacterized protein n=1 Tax=Heterodera trifolii TaxID=157864 RepID=A0ABD2ILQ7_9BILA
MRYKFAFLVIFATIFLLFLLDETLAGGTSSKHKSAKTGAPNEEKQRRTLGSLFNVQKTNADKRIVGSHGKLERVCLKNHSMKFIALL